MSDPFIIYALPRSRTAWLAHFLSYRDWRVGHEQAIFLRSISDIDALFALPRIGVVETAAAQGWRIIKAHVPNVKQVVVRRPVSEVVDAMLRVDMKGVATYDKGKLEKAMAYGQRMLDQIAGQPGVLTVDFEDLELEETCRRVFEFCLPYRLEHQWWNNCRRNNIQVDVPAYVKYYHENFEAISAFKKECWRELRRLAKEGALPLKRAA